MATIKKIKIGDTTYDLAVSASNIENGTVSNAWTAGTTAGPTIKTTVNGVEGTAVAIPYASTSNSGVVTTGSQSFAGQKTFTGTVVIKDLPSYAGISLFPSNAPKVMGRVQQNTTVSDGIVTKNNMALYQWSFDSDSTAGSNYYESYALPPVAADMTANAGYTILTTKNYPDSRYVKKSGDTMTGDLTISRSTTIADNTPAKLILKVTQSDNNLTQSASIAAYDDLDTSNNGLNMVVSTNSGMYICAGEGASSYLKNNASTAEDVHICADANIRFHTNCNTVANATNSVYINTSGVLYGACWNDYAEYRETTETEIPYGRVVVENGDDTLSLSSKRLQPGGNICSNTFGFAIGETEKAKMPIAVSGRALVYPLEDKNSYEPGDALCTGPNGTVSKMTREEIKEYPDRIIGYVSAIPSYDTWGTNNVPVNGRIWIKVK